MSRLVGALGALALLVPAVKAQSLVDDRIWGGSRTTDSVRAFDRFAHRIQVGAVAHESPVWRGANGSVWFGTGPLRLHFRTPSGIGSHVLSHGLTDLSPARGGGAWVATESTSLQLLDDLGNVQQSIPLAGPGRAVTIDASGRVWVAQQNMPGALLSWLDASASAPSTVSLPPDFGQVTDLVTDVRNGAGGHALLVGDGSSDVLEIDRSGVVVARHALGIDSPGGYRQVVLDRDGKLWLTGGLTGVWRADLTSGVAELVISVPGLGIAIDGMATPWCALASGTMIRIERDTLRSDWTTPGILSFLPFLDDGAGFHFANVVDRTGDLDGDGVANAAEITARSNPFDPQSTPGLTLDASSLGYRAGETVVLEARGGFGVAALVASQDLATAGVSIPGLVGDVRLDPATLLPLNVPIAVPGELRFDIPAVVPVADGLLFFQGIYLGIGLPQLVLSNEVAVRLHGRDPGTIRERFDNDQQLDRTASSGTWANGVAIAGELGGSGRLGSFDPTVGEPIAPDTWRWSTDAMTIPASHTLFGTPITVADGRFEFTDFVVPAGTTVVFDGAHPAVIRVSGRVQIDGEVRCDGSGVSADFDPRAIGQGFPVTYPPVPGQPGGAGGPGAGGGGDGADGALGTGVMPQWSGQDGEDIVAPALSGYASMSGSTGGGGSPLWPADGLRSSVTFAPPFALYCGQAAAGGGGGAFVQDGGDGVAVRTLANVLSDLAPPTAGGDGTGFLLAPPSASSLDHFLIGGAGGGGGGSHPLGMTMVEVNQPRGWHAGGGGAGGGGALVLRVGDSLHVGTTGVLSCAGGSGAEYSFGQPNVPRPAPGGGGSGGSLLLQVAGTVDQLGTLDVRGGAGGRSLFSNFVGTAETVGGDGGHGLVRLETPTTANLAALGTVLGPASLPNGAVGQLAARDPQVAMRSKWYPANLVTAPRWTSYRLEARVGNQVVVFSDDPANFNPADLPAQSLQLLVQGVRLAPNGVPAETPGPWRRRVADLADDNATAVRFMLIFDRTLHSNVEVLDLVIRYEE